MRHAIDTVSEHTPQLSVTEPVTIENMMVFGIQVMVSRENP